MILRSSLLKLANEVEFVFFCQGVEKDGSVSKKHATITVGEHVPGRRPDVGLFCCCIPLLCIARGMRGEENNWLLNVAFMQLMWDNCTDI